MSASINPIYVQIQEAVRAIQARSGLRPEVGLILGSGLGAVAQELTDAVRIPYGEIPHFHATAVEGHSGHVLLGRMKGVPTVILQGRFHFYEGYSMQSVALPTRVICALGAHTLLLTNAAGGINTRFRPGDLMIIEDHINLMGDNPLKGPNLAQLGPRFPDLSEAYSRECVRELEAAAVAEEIPVHHGVYAGVLGPTYETPAEVRMLRTMGADAVGMSTVPETIAANHLGVRVSGVSLITNLAAGLSPQKLTHEEVMANSKAGVARLTKLIVRAIPSLTHRTQS